jgi:hypothetical protein
MSEAALLSPIEGSAKAREEPTALELEDMLYDILANGADPALSPGVLEAVQTFLHEHARSRRSQAEFLAFFAQHRLPTVRQSPLSIALPPVERGPAVLHSVREAIEPFEVAPAPRRPSPQRSSLGLLAAGVVLAAISGGGAYAFATARAELARVHAEAEQTAAKLGAVQSEAAALRQALEQNAALVRQIDQRSELLLQTLASPLDPAAR